MPKLQEITYSMFWPLKFVCGATPLNPPPQVAYPFKALAPSILLCGPYNGWNPTDPQLG